MRSYQFRQYGEPLELVEAADSEPAGTEVLVRVLACGACHSDLHMWEGYFDLGNDRKLDVRSDRTLPFTLGHEIVGKIVAVGPDAEGAAVGDRGVVFPWIGCRSCEICNRDGEHLCLQPRALGTYRNGGFSDRVVVPHPRYLFDYGDTPLELACTYACSGLAAYSALQKIADCPGGQIVIIGAGGVGLAALSIEKETSDRQVIIVDIRREKLDAAERLGADHVVDGTDAAAHKQIKRLTNGGAYAILDCVGSEATATLGMGVLARSGVLVVIGLFGGSLQVPLPLLPFKNLTIRGSYLGSLPEMGELMELVRAGRLRPIPIETRALDAAQQTLDDLAAGTIVGRVVLTP